MLGLRQNWKQFTLLVIVNAFVGGMVGLERSILPQIAEQDFGIAAKTAIFSFIVAFGITKAISNYLAGAWAGRFGRKRLLVTGWLFAIPVPLMLMYAETWSLVIVANVLLGINQGLTWSTTVVMKIDLVGERERGLAMGLNEFAGYTSVAIGAFATAAIAADYGLRPYPFIMGIGFTLAGLILSLFFVRDTEHHVAHEAKQSTTPRLERVVADTTWRHRNLSAVTQAGLVNNLNDGMVWGLLPIVLATRGLDLDQTGIITAAYPATWGISQIVTGKLADIFPKRIILAVGMALQGIAILLMIWATGFLAFLALAIALGLGTAIVYPTFLATVAEQTHPSDRAHAMGTFRFWRDAGYAIGALLTGIVTDVLNAESSIGIVGALTLVSAVILRFRMSAR